MKTRYYSTAFNHSIFACPWTLVYRKFKVVALVARWSWFDFRFSLFVFRISFFAFRFSFFDFRYSHWIRKSYFDIQNPILTITLSRNILFWHSNYYSDIRTEPKNPILTFKILFWHSHWVWISYFDIQNPILTFELSRKILFRHSKSYFDIRTESENSILIYKLHPILSFAMSRNILFWLIANVKLDFECFSIFALSPKILFWHSKSYFDIHTESENPISTFKILFWHSQWVGKSYFDI